MIKRACIDNSIFITYMDQVCLHASPFWLALLTACMVFDGEGTLVLSHNIRP
jgi:hypothetical protein